MTESTPFALHPLLARDCHQLGRLGRLRVLLHASSLVDWFILVPETEATELHEVEASLRAELLEGADRLARHLKAGGADKINVAAIGNLVPQLHYHVVARRRDDPAWPGVVWGRLPASETRDEAGLQALVEGLRRAGIALA